MKPDDFLPAPRLRLLDPERDGPALHAILGDPESCRYLPRPAFATVEETIDQLRRWTDGWEDTSWVTVDDHDTATGRIAYYSHRPGQWDAACMIVPSARGTGLARRALAVSIDRLFEDKLANKVIADIDPDNTGSIRTYEQLGFTREGQLRAVWDTHIGVRDSVMFGLLRDDPRPWR